MKIRGPLHSEEARGTIEPFLTFSKRRTGQQARYQKKQKDAESPDQLIQREKFLNASLSCRFMEYGVAFYGISFFGVDSDYYNQKAQGKKITGYNFCIRENINSV